MVILSSELAIYLMASHGICTFAEVIDETTRFIGWLLEHFGPENEGN